MQTPTTTPPAPTPAPAPAAAPASTPPATQAAAPASPEKPAVDPLVGMLRKTLGNIVTPDGAPVDTKPVDLTPKPSVSIGEFVAKEALKKAEAPAAPAAPTPPAQPAATPAPAAPATQAAEKKVVVKPAEPAAPVAPAAPAEPATPPAAPTAATPPAPVSDPDAEFVATLNEAQREELELAKYAEEKDPTLKGQAKKTVDYFKALEKFATENPDASEDEQQEFIAKNKPKFSEAQRRRIERQMITDQATAAAQREVDAKLKKQEEELHALRVKPEVDAAAQEFSKSLESLDLPADLGLDGSIKDVAAAINKDGFEAASKEFVIEAPIVRAHNDAAKTYIAISHGAEKYNPSNPQHRWLDQFISKQATKLIGTPQAKVGGKTFLSPADYAQKAAADPKGTARAHWTFTQNQILDMIKVNAALQINGELARAKQAAEYIGKRTGKKSDKTETPDANGKLPGAENSSPRAGGSQVPGPVSATPPTTPEAKFLETIMPGASKIVAGS